MAAHSKDTGGALKAKGSRKASGRDVHSQGVDAEQDANEHGVAGLEHKVPLSEAVLKAVGLYGGIVHASDPKGTDAETAKSNARARALSREAGYTGQIVRDLRDSDGAIFLPAPESADDCTSPADVVAFLSAKHQGYFERTPLADGVSVRFTYGPAAEIVTGYGPTTKAAVTAMAKKLGESFACLTDKTGASDE